MVDLDGPLVCAVIHYLLKSNRLGKDVIFLHKSFPMIFYYKV